MITTNKQASIKGQYKIIAKKSNIIVKETNWFDNMILDDGFDLLLQNTNINSLFIKEMEIGTGTSAVLVSDRQLENSIAVSSMSTRTTMFTKKFPNDQSILLRGYRFNTTDSNQVITEVGVRCLTAINNNTLFSRALITDDYQIPSPIDLTGIDELDIYYRLILIANTTHGTGSVVLNGVTHQYRSVVHPLFFYNNSTVDKRMAMLSNAKAIAYSDELIANDQYFNFKVSQAQITRLAYVPKSKTVNSRLTFATGVANFATGIRRIGVGYGHVDMNNDVNVQIEFTPPIMKTSSKVLTLDTSMQWSLA